MGRCGVENGQGEELIGKRMASSLFKKDCLDLENNRLEKGRHLANGY